MLRSEWGYAGLARRAGRAVAATTAADASLKAAHRPRPIFATRVRRAVDRRGVCVAAATTAPRGTPRRHPLTGGARIALARRPIDNS